MLGTALVLALVVPAGVAVAQPPEAGPDGAAQTQPSSPEGASGGTGLWVVRLADPALAAYAGGVAGLAPTSPRVTGAPKLDVDAPASVAYREHLEDLHDRFATRMQQTLGRSVEIPFRYRNVLNALAVRVSAAEAARLAGLPGVAAVYEDELRELDTDVSHDLIGSAAFWDGATASGAGSRGEGVIVGMLDTGVNAEHPSFAATDGDGYTHTNPYGSGTYVGVCADPESTDHEDLCNDKLIGAWNFHPDAPSATDWQGHGSHVGSTIAGNKHDASFTVGPDEYARTIRGVAPRANVISYLVCFPTCPTTSSIAAIDQAVADGVDVLNYSISGVDDPWNDSVDLAFLDAFSAGMVVVASAGNSGPGPSTVAKTGPWNASVAASTHSRVIAHTVDVTAPDPVPPVLEGVTAVPGSGPSIASDIAADIRHDPLNVRGCTAFTAGSFSDAIALIQRGACPFATKVNHAAAAGAVAVVIYNDVGGPPITMGGLEGTAIPAVMVDDASGDALATFVVDNAPTPTAARIDAETALVFDDSWEDLIAGFSSRGPSRLELLAPTFAAPGVNILAAGAGQAGATGRYFFQQGTSMSSPHGAGASALLVALHQDWSPAEIRSALAASAPRDTILKDDGATPADPFDMGSGRIDLDRAARAGLVLDETHARFVEANPDRGGDPKTLNLPAMVDMSCTTACSWTRTVRSVAAADASYTLTVDAPAAMDVTVDPPDFTLAAGAEQELVITADVSDLPQGVWAFAEVGLVTADTHASGEPIAAAHYPVAVLPAPALPVMTVHPAELTSVLHPGEQVTQTLTIGNEGSAALVWNVVEDGVAPGRHTVMKVTHLGELTSCAAPSGTPWVEVAPLSGTVDPGGADEVDVAFHSTDLAPGTYEANLCIEGNDPNRPVAVVPLTLSVAAPAVTAVEVSPSAASVVVGAVQQFTATARYSDGSSADVTTTAEWSSGDVGVATVEAGSATGVGAGTTQVSAALGGVSGSATLTVTVEFTGEVPRGIAHACGDLDELPDFGDIGGFAEPAQEAMRCLAAYGFSVGFGDGTYRPARPVLRYQMALFLARLLGYAEDAGAVVLPEPGPSPFTDLGALDDEARAAVALLHELNVTTGTTATTFSPFRTVSRRDMASFLLRVQDALADGSYPPTEAFDFPDVPRDLGRAGDIYAIAGRGIAVGYADGLFRPFQEVRRVEMALFVMRHVDENVEAERLPPLSARR